MARALKRNSQNVWFVTGTEKTPKGKLDKVIEYSKPVMKRMPVTYTSGEGVLFGAGLLSDCERIIINYKVKGFSVDDGTFVFVDVIPELDDNGNLKKNSDGDYISEPDYFVKTTLDSKKSTVCRYGIKKVVNNG